ncbi:MAG: CreA family protein [Hyphomicrobium sp.]|nr:CreA family protein [Hyphomicrobium sp.]
MISSRSTTRIRNAAFRLAVAAAVFVGVHHISTPANAAEPDLIYKKTTVWKFLAPDAKIGTYGIDDPEVEGVACHFSVPEIGGWKGWIGVAEELSQASLSCKQYGPIVFKRKLKQGEEMFSQRRSFFFKRMQIVRGCDTKRNMLVYLVYTDKLIEGSPENSTSSVPIIPWGTTQPAKCSEWISD